MTSSGGGAVLDVVIRGGAVLDGTGSPARRADVGIVGDRIVAIGDLSAASAGVDIAASGLVVTPGFIDVHGHDDAAALVDPTVYWKVRQGVTSVVTGNCGFGAAPHRWAIPELAAWWPAVADLPPWDGYAGYLARVDETGPAVNLAVLVGHGTARAEAMGMDDRAPTADELATMSRRVDEGLVAGAVGLSTGLIYNPGRFATADEIVALARLVAAAGGLYTSHIRDEGDRLLDSVREAIEVGRRAGLPVQLSHHKAYGRRNWGKVSASLRLVEEARAAGHAVAVDQYPYTASATMLAALIDNRLIHPDGGAPLIGGEAVRITSTPAQRAYEGRTLAEIATTLDLDVVAAAERVVDEVGLAAMVVIESMDEADVREVMRQPYTMIGSDGVMGPGTPHPRVFGTFPRVLGRYARDGVLELADAVHRMTGLPAATFGLIGRGAVTVGAFADLVVLDPAAVVDRGTFDQPDQAPAGICEVLVNGRRAVADGALTQARAGIALRRA